MAAIVVWFVEVNKWKAFFVSEGRRGPGRPLVYSGSEPGAPKITIRFSQDTYDWFKGREEGVRVYLERLVHQDREQ